MLKFAECKLLSTHLFSGAVNGTHTIVKNNNLYLLDGYNTVIINNERQYLLFKRGWYDINFNFISDITIEDQNDINECLPF